MLGSATVSRTCDVLNDHSHNGRFRRKRSQKNKTSLDLKIEAGQRANFYDESTGRWLPNVVGAALEAGLAGEVPRAAITVIREVILPRLGSGSVQAWSECLVINGIIR